MSKAEWVEKATAALASAGIAGPFLDQAVSTLMFESFENSIRGKRRFFITPDKHRCYDFANTTKATTRNGQPFDKTGHIYVVDVGKRCVILTTKNYA